MKMESTEFEALVLDPDLLLRSLNESGLKYLVQELNSHAWSEHKLDLKALQRQADESGLVCGQVSPPPEGSPAQAQAAQIQALCKQALADEVAYSESQTGHNPTLFPPYFDGGRQAAAGGFFSVALNEKFPQLGRVGFSVAAFNPGGHVEHSSLLGALTVAPSSRTVSFRATAGLSGALTAFGLLGYARASAQLISRLSIFDMATQSFRSVEARSSIGEISFGRLEFRGHQFTASGSAFVRAGEILLLSGGLRVSAGCGGIGCGAVANLRLQMNSMAVN